MSAAQQPFHAPADANAWDFLFEDYARTRAEIERIARSQDDPEWCRAMRHYLAAANRDGRGISALLPVSARNDAEVSAIATRWIEVPGVFPGTSIEVVIMVADAP